jgi:HTH-type transcriptional regulator / antitoxin HigA
MAKTPTINELFLAAAEIEAETPITIGVNMVGPDGRFTKPQPVKRQEWDAWASNFPLKEMRRLKFSLPTATSAAEVVLGFFGVPSPESWQAAWQATPIAFRQTKVFDARKEAVAAWVREAELVANQIPLAEFDEAKLRASLNELRRLTREEASAALSRAQKICSRCGVALVLVAELSGTRISGCARWLSDKHAMVGLTPRYKSGDQLWFTFFHELAHILLHRDRQSFVVDNAAGEMGDDVVDPDMARYEEEADRFAADTLIPPAELAKLPRHKPDELTNELIQDFAKSIGIHPGTVIGRLQHDKVLGHWQGNKLKQKLEWGFVTEE